MEYFLANIFPKVLFIFHKCCSSILVNVMVIVKKNTWAEIVMTVQLNLSPNKWWRSNFSKIVARKLKCPWIYSSVYVVHLQFFLTNATDWIGTIGIDDLNDSSITKVKKLGNMEVLFYWFLQMPILCSTEKTRLKILLISKNAIQSQFFAHYSGPKQKESMNIKRNTYTVWENQLKSLIQNGEWSELRWHSH